VRLRDILKPYIYPVAIVTAVIFVYFAIKYRKLGIIKSIVKPAIILILIQAILLSLLAIVRFPMGGLTTALVLFVYVTSLTYISANMIKISKEVIYERGKCMLCLSSDDTLKFHPGDLIVEGGVIVNGSPYGISPVNFAKVTNVTPLIIK
jgi:hypothetical protein